MLDITMHRSQLPRSGMALGGIGGGWFEIGQDGGFTNWSIHNNWPLFTGNRFPYNPKEALFFLLWIREEHAEPRLVLLQIEDGHSAAAIDYLDYQYIFPWLSGVDTIRIRASFPFAHLSFEQEGLPIEVELRAWSPFIPGNVKDSALPLAFFDFEIRSLSARPIDLQILAAARNTAAYDQPDRVYENRRIRDGSFSAVLLGAGQTDPDAPSTGSLCLASFAEESTAYMGWEHWHPYYERLLREYPMPEFDDTDGRNGTDKETSKRRADPRCFSTIGRAARFNAIGDSLKHNFVLAWHFPNLYGRSVSGALNTNEPHGHDRFEGHYYSNFFESSEAVARYAYAERERLLVQAQNFHRTFFDSSLPAFVLDQVNSQLNTFRTSSWLTKTGMFGINEGLTPLKAFAGIATTDVAMYGQIAAALLFPELDRMTIDIWRNFQQPDGRVIHSVTCNSYEPVPSQVSGRRIDMPAQFVFMALRSALWSGERERLATVWENVKAALAYVLRERDKNGDGLSEVEGSNCSYDNLHMFGVAPFIVSQWLASLALANKVAAMLGDQEFLDHYAGHLERGRETLERTTWNGQYFNLYFDETNPDAPERFGCMVDQIIGDGAARQLGLPPVLDPAKVESTMRSIWHHNYHRNQGLRNCQWPGDGFLHALDKNVWVDQGNTCWTGVELNFAAHLYRFGFHEEAEEIVRNVDERHRRQGIYWDHKEFGGHYFRPMAALGIPNAFLGLTYDGETLRIAPARPLPDGRWCFLLPGAYGTFFYEKGTCRLELKAGFPPLKTIDLPANSEIVGFAGAWTSVENNGRRLYSIK